MAAHIAQWRTNGIEVVTLQRPPVNAMDLALLEELKELFTALADDSSARAVVLTGQGPTFCAGLDVKVVPQYSKAEQLRLLEVLNEMILAVYGCSFPGSRGHQRARYRRRPGTRALLRLENRRGYGHPGESC